MSYKKADHFSRRAQKEGYAARSVYKLQEMQRMLLAADMKSGILHLAILLKMSK